MAARPWRFESSPRHTRSVATDTRSFMSERETAFVLGASSGLGSELRRLCEEREIDTIAAGSSLTDGGTDSHRTLHVDLRNDASVDAFLERLREEREITRFFWNAGRLLKGDFLNQSSSDVRDTLNVNLTNGIVVVQETLRLMQEVRGEKSFVAIASTTGYKPRPDEAIYAASKFGMVGFVRSFGELENEDPSLKVTIVYPGGMKTPGWRGEKPPGYEKFNDPQKVAEKIIEFVLGQKTPFESLKIPRGSV